MVYVCTHTEAVVEGFARHPATIVTAVNPSLPEPDNTLAAGWTVIIPPLLPEAAGCGVSVAPSVRQED